MQLPYLFYQLVLCLADYYCYYCTGTFFTESKRCGMQVLMKKGVFMRFNKDGCVNVRENEMRSHKNV
jgi:hypothetical protein